MARPHIWVSDLLLAMSALAPADDRTADAIAELLGFERVSTPAAQPGAAGRAGQTALAIDTGLIGAAVRLPPSPAGPLPPVSPAGSDAPQEAPPGIVARPAFPVERLPAIAPRLAIGERRDADTPLRLTAAAALPPPALVPLLSPLAGRFIVQELIASSRSGPEPDIAGLIESLARYETPQPVPLQVHRTLARGAQLLVDDGEGMEPFAVDQEAMVGLVRRLAGDALIDVRRIHEIPDPADPFSPWDPPPPGTPVLALTDLGLAGRNECPAPDLAAAWRSAAATLAARGSSLTALVPYPAARWPGELAACMRLVPWDRSTTTAYARHAPGGRPPR
jgi:hypothetical protein